MNNTPEQSFTITPSLSSDQVDNLLDKAESLAEMHAEFNLLASQKGYVILKRYGGFSVVGYNAYLKVRRNQGLGILSELTGSMKGMPSLYEVTTYPEAVWWVAQQPPLDDGSDAFGKEHTE